MAMGPFIFPMINPVITKKTGEYQTEESCLSLDGVRPCNRGFMALLLQGASGRRGI